MMSTSTQMFWSQNMRGKHWQFIHEFENILNEGPNSPIIFMQDMGKSGPEGPHDLIQALRPHKVIVNVNCEKKSRTTGIIIHKDWECVGQILRHDSGGLIGTKIRKGTTELFVMSAYLPPAIDLYGVPKIFDSMQVSGPSKTQEETYSIYATAEEWIKENDLWILGGDLNETIMDYDRKKLSSKVILTILMTLILSQISFKR